MERDPDTANEIEAWVGVVEAVRWRNFAEVRDMFKDAVLIDGYVIFNIRQKRYGLITVVHHSKATDGKQSAGHLSLRSFLTHKEYDHRSNRDRVWNKISTVLANPAKMLARAAPHVSGVQRATPVDGGFEQNRTKPHSTSQEHMANIPRPSPPLLTSKK